MKFNNRNVYISPSARIGKNVRIGDNSAIYDNVIIGDNSVISNNCVIGEPANGYYFDAKYTNSETIIGEESLIRSHSIIYAGVITGNKFSTGHRVTIREKSTFGNACRVGTLSDIQGYVTFGDSCWLHSNVHIGQKSTIGNYVFIYPYVVFTNDPHPPSDVCIGPIVGNFSQIAVGTVLLPGVTIGKHCLVGAQSLVNRDVPDYALFAGNPAKFIKDVRELKSRETGLSHYPWPDNFKRNMPWEADGFDNWKLVNGYEND